jgi:NTP pyrophosphatase (non-canonical NTP hydrolase)
MIKAFHDFVAYLENTEDLNLDPQTNRLVHAALGIGGESGEIVDIIKKAYVYHKPIDKTALLEELSDILHYIVMMCNVYEWALDDVMEFNMAKLKKRYPDGYSHANALARKDKEVTDD